MVTQDARRLPATTAAPGGAATSPGGTGQQDAERKVRIARVTPAGAATLAGAAAGALGLVWVLYERVLPFTGVLGFWLTWYGVFLLLYASMARLQWNAREVTHRLAMVAVATGGAVVCAVVLGEVLFVAGRGAAAVWHVNFW